MQYDIVFCLWEAVTAVTERQINAKELRGVEWKKNWKTASDVNSSKAR